MLTVIVMETTSFLGCSRGLGKAIAKEWVQKFPQTHSQLISRKEDSLKLLQSEISGMNTLLSYDFSKEESVDGLLKLWKEEPVQRIFYMAGGGPYGLFGSKNWKDHQWALQVGFLTPARLIHSIIQEKLPVQQLIVVGSAIAEDKPDPKAASYSAAKHALKGLVDSINKEGCPIDLRIFSPGYIDTELLPPQAEPRVQGKPLWKPEELAVQFVQWASNPNGEKSLYLEAPG